MRHPRTIPWGLIAARLLDSIVECPAFLFIVAPSPLVSQLLDLSVPPDVVILSADGQRTTCTTDAMACRFDTSSFTPRQWDNAQTIDWMPDLPGAYNFAYEATDLCNLVSQNITVRAVALKIALILRRSSALPSCVGP